jgi:hypothetical protein
MEILTNAVVKSSEKVDLPEEISTILFNFPNQSLTNNTDPKKFPRIHQTRARLLSKWTGRKIIPR